jgi:hypothetical protein
VENVLRPHSVKTVFKEMKNKPFSLSTGVSNKGNLEVVPLYV